MAIKFLNTVQVDTDVLYVDAANDRVGIGTVSPNATLDVLGTVAINKAAPSPTNYQVDIQKISTDPDVTGFGVRIDADFSGTKAAVSDIGQGGIKLDVDSSAIGTITDEHRVYGINNDVRYSGLPDAAWAVYNRFESNGGDGRTTNAGGVFNLVQTDTTADHTNTALYGVYNDIDIQDAGIVSTIYGTRSVIDAISNRTSNVGTIYGSRVDIDLNSSNNVDYGTMHGYMAVIDNNAATAAELGTQYLFRGQYDDVRGDNAWGIHMQGDKNYLEGTLGIGTDSPSNKLEVVGSNAVRIHDGTDQGSIFFRGDRDDVYIKESNYQLLFGAPSGMLFELDTNNNDGDVFNVMHRGSSRMYINGASGNVGIGTTSPTLGKLQVQAATGSVGFNAGTSSSPERGNLYFDTDGTGWKFNIGKSQSGTFSPLMTFEDNGNVGIGTTSPAADFVVSHEGTSGIEIEANFQTGVNNILSFDRTAGALAYETMRLEALDFWFVGLGVERMRIDSSGYVEIKNNAGNANASLTLANSDLSIGINQAIGYLNFKSNDLSGGTSAGGVGGVGVYSETEYNTGNTPSYMSFYTHSNTNNTGTILGSVTERMRIASNGAIQFNDYGAGTLVTDASGNITVSSGGGAGGPYLPLSAGSSYPLTNTLFLGSTQNNSNEYNWLVFNNQASGYGDWNIYKLGNNNLAFGYGTTAGASYNNSLTLEYNGNVGIGTTDPSQKLEVSTDNYNVSKFVGNTDGGSGYVGAVVEIESNNDARGRGVYLTHRNATDTSDNEWYAGVPYTGDGYSIGNAVYATSINSAAGPAHKDQSKLFIENTGNVGIGTTSPGKKLDVEGNIRSIITGGSTSAEIDISSGATWRLRSNPTTGTNSYGLDIVKGGAGTDVKMSIDSLGNVGIGVIPNAPAGNIQLDVGDNGCGMTSRQNNELVLQANANYSTYAQTGKPATRLNLTNTGEFLFSNAPAGAAIGDTIAFTERMRIDSNGNVGIGTTSPTSKLDVTNGEGKFCVDSKTHNLTNAFTTCLTVNLNSHTGCYVTLTCFGDWGSHSAAAYRGEFFLQNGANGYAEPGIILRQDDNTSNGTDQIVCQIVDPTGSGNPKDFEIQIRTTATTGTTSFTGQLTYTVQGQFNSIT